MPGRTERRVAVVTLVCVTVKFSDCVKRIERFVAVGFT
jgi:hypothetical protein